jgi:diadenylate cyclase
MQSIPQHFRPVLEISILWFIFYYILNSIKGTRAVQVFKAFILLLVVFLITQRLNLEVLTWILNKIFAISLIAFLIIFHPELRRTLMRLGGGRFLSSFLHEHERKSWEELINSVVNLSQKKIGALIAIQKQVGLRTYIESGVTLDCLISEELFETIFSSGSSLHDGGVIIEGVRIAAAGCLFPLTTNPRITKTLGMRHRAALGLSEESDCLVIVVSEETGLISLAEDGILRRDIDELILREALQGIYSAKGEKKVINSHEKLHIR